MEHNTGKKITRLGFKDILAIVLLVLLVLSLIFLFISKSESAKRMETISNHNYYANQYVQNVLSDLKRDVAVKPNESKYLEFVERVDGFKGLVYCAYPKNAASEIVAYLEQLEKDLKAYERYRHAEPDEDKAERAKLYSKIVNSIEVIIKICQYCDTYVNGGYDVVDNEKELLEEIKKHYKNDMEAYL